MKQEKQIKVKKEKKVLTKEEKISKIGGYITALIVILSVGYFIIFAILWVNESKNISTVNGELNVRINLLYGNLTELLIGLVFFILGVLFYAANTKKMKVTSYFLTLIFTIIGVVLINSIPGLIIGIIIVVLEAIRVWFKIDLFKENWDILKEKMNNFKEHFHKKQIEH